MPPARPYFILLLCSVETLAKSPKHSIMAADVEKVAKSGEKWGKLWISQYQKDARVGMMTVVISFYASQ